LGDTPKPPAGDFSCTSSGWDTYNPQGLCSAHPPGVAQAKRCRGLIHQALGRKNPEEGLRKIQHGSQIHINMDIGVRRVEPSGRYQMMDFVTVRSAT
jgi:hypothetical protein